jgi:hypothetical protein
MGPIPSLAISMG